MIVLAGTKLFHLESYVFQNATCPKCQNPEKMTSELYRQYAHLTLIPIFPTDKAIFLTCSNCNETFDYSELPLQTQQMIDQKYANRKTPTPIWMFSGIFVILFCIGYFVNDYHQKKVVTKILIENPKSGDVYNIKLSNGYYSTFKIDNIARDTIFAIYNDYKIDLPYNFEAIDAEENYSENKVIFLEKDLINLAKSGNLNSIIRNNP